MVIFGHVERHEVADFGDDWVVEGFFPFELGNFFPNPGEFLRRSENDAPVLFAHVVPLPVFRSGIVGGEEGFEQRVVRNYGRIISDFHHFGVTARPRFYALIGGIRNFSAHVSGFYLQYSGKLRKYGFQTPETSSSEICFAELRKIGNVFDEPHRKRIDAVADVFIGQPLSNEYVAEMPAARLAGDFSAHSVGVGAPFHLSGNGVVEARPSASRIEFGIRKEKRGSALAADESAFFMVRNVFARERRFGAFAQYDAGFFVREKGHFRFHGSQRLWNLPFYDKSRWMQE